MLEVFTNHYATLAQILPVKTLSPHFISEGIISFEEEQIIQQTAVQSQAAIVILRKIGTSLQASSLLY